MEPRPFPAVLAPWRGDASEPMRLQELKISVVIVGHLATTTWELSVHNPQARPLEGELVFPLGDGQTVSRFALEVNGALREGVVVDKEKGRQAFEDTVRRQIDPGLLEKTAGNNFRARVYPIPANGCKRLLLAYEQTLENTGDGLLFHLPLQFEEVIEAFSLRVEVLDQTDSPRLESSPAANFSFKSWKSAFIAEDRQSNFAPRQPLRFVVPKSAEAVGAYIEQRDGRDYFCVALSPDLKPEPKLAPKKLLIVWDASGSARNRELNRELDLIGAYLGWIGNCTVDLVVFRDQMEAPRSFRIGAGKWSALRKALEDAPQDGATHWGCLDLGSIEADEILFFSDGLNTLGEAVPRFADCPINTVNSAQVADPRRLSALAGECGGVAIDLCRMDTRQALHALQHWPAALIRVEDVDAAAEALLPTTGCPLSAHLTLAGILKKGTDKPFRLKLHFGVGRKSRRTRTLTIDPARSRVEAPVARLWAQLQLAELERDGERNRAAILELAQQFGIVTSETSLIVLDSVEDYLRYRIRPPEELRQEYEQRLHLVQESRQQEEATHLEQVVSQFEERVKWWGIEFKPKPPRPEPKKGARPPVCEAMPPPMVAMGMPAAPSPAMTGAEMDYMCCEGEPDAAAIPKEESREAQLPVGSIALKAWSPDTPYTRLLMAAKPKERYPLYLMLRAEWGRTPGFYLDVADLFREWGEEDLALRILTNLAELKLESHALLRVLGYRLRQSGRLDLALWCLEEVLRLRPDEPQSHRDLALAAAEAGQAERAFTLLWHVVKTPWDARFRDINLIACGEMNAVLAAAPGGIETSGVDARLLRNLPVDVRVLLNWDTDNSDMDLHVVDPRGEECYYAHKETEIGGRISADITQGYGPEEFLLRRAIPGVYTVRAKFFGTREQTVIGATTVILELYLHYGTDRVENKSTTLRLDGPGRIVDIGEFCFVSS